jgi:hypothetical protein
VPTPIGFRITTFFSALGSSPRNLRAGRGCCLSPAACFISGAPDLVGLFCSRDSLLVAAGLPSDQGCRAEDVSPCCIPGAFPGSLKGWQGLGFFFGSRGVGVRSESRVVLCACSTQKPLWAERISGTVSRNASSFCCLFWLSSWGGGWSGAASERAAGLGSWT